MAGLRQPEVRKIPPARDCSAKNAAPQVPVAGYPYVRFRWHGRCTKGAYYSRNVSKQDRYCSRYWIRGWIVRMRGSLLSVLAAIFILRVNEIMT